MSSLVNSFSSCTPTNFTPSTAARSRLHALIHSTATAETSSTRRIEIQSGHHKISSSDYHQPSLRSNGNPTSVLGRRESIVGCGFCMSLLDALFSQAQPSAAAAQVAPCELTLAPSGLAFCDQVVGSGPKASKGKLIKAHYVGKLENGKIFDSSYDRGRPLTFRIGAGEVIKGWDEGILGGQGVPPMLAGGKRTLKLPPELGYGMRGAGCRQGFQERSRLTMVVSPSKVVTPI
ncbi:peptidyl-prolyl cis-trans isomerase FKBP13, chloroplastic isoform X3 [Malania oleifera]|uniref:peptidyl-prolyl cis-trans isomerase FKBP13, chloroplastic isoform X3 n=1 Tax=Malania oleifera TaxID=397392 RepID=UPI0025AEB8D7|nr:peptidyl-prolyl cis-trans isomerase FKBP13, chloroplastic isoform X3 [Malania oleifera]